MMKLFRSLQAKYMIFILLAIFLIFFIQITYVMLGNIWLGITDDKNGQSDSEELTNYEVVEKKWHEDASELGIISRERINQHFSKWKQLYPEASMFWVDENGNLAEQVDVKEKFPSEWTPAFTAKFIKKRYNGDPFTVIAFVGKNELNGFIVLEIPRSTFHPPLQKIYDRYGIILGIGMVFIIVLFILVSFLFFRGIRRRLLQLQEAMAVRDVDGLPLQIGLKKKDEIGQLEQTFNQMVFELRESRQREQEEEQLRRELISSLSHDLRTPLTKIRAQSYSISKEDLSQEGKLALKSLDDSIINIDRLIENLMSYTLLIASKFNYNPSEIDVIRFMREYLASWYPVFEKEEFEIDIELQSFNDNIWAIDPIWLGRILDNLFQNVLRHAKSGRYISVVTESTDQHDAFIIIDRGKGMKNVSNEKGAGIGLSIVDMMVKGMKLDWDIETCEHGTAIKIKKFN